MRNKHASLLDHQPLSAAMLHEEQRSQIVISAVLGESSETLVLSRYLDDVWQLWPFFDQSSRSESEKRINWLSIPDVYRPVFKAVLYRYWKVGRPGFSPPVAGTVRDAFIRVAVFFRYLYVHEINSLVDVTKLIVSNYVQWQNEQGKMNARSLRTQLMCIELLYVFRDEHPNGLKCELWADSTCKEVAGFGGDRKSDTRLAGKTPLIPEAIIASLFTFAERIIGNADRLLDERDSGLRRPFHDPDLLLIRDASFFLIGLLTGMRCDEILGIRVGAGRSEYKNGFQYNWIKSVEHKTKKGSVEYLVASMGLNILHVMERWSEPYRESIIETIDSFKLAPCPIGNSEQAKELDLLRRQSDCLFLGKQKQVVSGRSWGKIMNSFATLAGVSWNLAPHQLRRAYAWTFVRHRLGNLLMLKEQFKHSSIEMSQLYAANPLQDEALYDECLTELFEYRIEIVRRWINEGEPLSGGAGRKILQMRAHAFPNREALIKETANKVSIRSTGHSWCLSQFADGCGGQGLYESGRCEGCGSSVIDGTFNVVWNGIHEHLLDLRSDAANLGPGAQQRVERDVEVSRKVLSDLRGAGFGS